MSALYSTTISWHAMTQVQILCAALLVTGPAKAASAQANAGSAEERVKALVAQMTLEEKVSQLDDDAEAIPRLRVPACHWWNEGLHGMARQGAATVFPQAIGLAATFDEPLVRSVGDVTSTEFRAKYRTNRAAGGGGKQYQGFAVWSPNVNSVRDPRWVRGQESYGEDPYLAARTAIAFVQGLQGPDADRPKIVAAFKHYVVHSGLESPRHQDKIIPSSRDLEDTYLPAFRAAISEAGQGR